MVESRCDWESVKNGQASVTVTRGALFALELPPGKEMLPTSETPLRRAWLNRDIDGKRFMTFDTNGLEVRRYHLELSIGSYGSGSLPFSPFNVEAVTKVIVTIVP